MIELKTKREIAKIELASRYTAEIRDIIAESALPGVSTQELDDICVREMKKRNVESVFLNYKPNFSKLAFPANICLSINEEIVHGIPKKNKILKEGDIISIDFASKYDNFIGDTATTIAVGKISDELKTFLKISEQSLYEGINQCLLGNYLGDIGHAIDSYLKSNNLHVIKNYYGHGVGRALHEPPMVPHHGKPKTGMKLVEGFVFTIEPMICQKSDQTIQMDDGWTVCSADGLPAAHFEHTIAITKDGPMVLTKL